MFSLIQASAVVNRQSTLTTFEFRAFPPSLNFPGQRLLVWYTTVQTLPGQDP